MLLQDMESIGVMQLIDEGTGAKSLFAQGHRDRT
jgi:hypothetical protein